MHLKIVEQFHNNVLEGTMLKTVNYSSSTVYKIIKRIKRILRNLLDVDMCTWDKNENRYWIMLVIFVPLMHCKLKIGQTHRNPSMAQKHFHDCVHSLLCYSEMQVKALSCKEAISKLFLRWTETRQNANQYLKFFWKTRNPHPLDKGNSLYACSSVCSSELSPTKNIWRVVNQKIQTQRRPRTVEQL